MFRVRAGRPGPKGRASNRSGRRLRTPCRLPIPDRISLKDRRYDAVCFNSRRLSLLSVLLLSQQSEHVFLVCLDSRLIEGVDPLDVSGDPAGGFEECEHLSQGALVRA